MRRRVRHRRRDGRPHEKKDDRRTQRVQECCGGPLHAGSGFSAIGQSRGISRQKPGDHRQGESNVAARRPERSPHDRFAVCGRFVRMPAVFPRIVTLLETARRLLEQSLQLRANSFPRDWEIPTGHASSSVDLMSGGARLDHGTTPSSVSGNAVVRNRRRVFVLSADSICRATSAPSSLRSTSTRIAP